MEDKINKEDLVSEAWALIANCHGWTDPNAASPGWKEAAERWRDSYHQFLTELEF